MQLGSDFCKTHASLFICLEMLVAVKYKGNRSEVKYTVSLGELVVDVDWNETKTVSTSGSSNNAMFNLVRGVSEAVGVWFNLTGKMQCFDHVELARQFSEVNEFTSDKASPRVASEAAVPAGPGAQPRVCGTSYGHHSKTGMCTAISCVSSPSYSQPVCFCSLRRVLGWRDLQRESASCQHERQRSWARLLLASQRTA